MSVVVTMFRLCAKREETQNVPCGVQQPLKPLTNGCEREREKKERTMTRRPVAITTEMALSCLHLST